MKYVYELVNAEGVVEYVGESANPKKRLYHHTKNKPIHSGHGKFYGREDLTLNVVAGPMSMREARDLEDELKERYGFEKTERTRGLATISKEDRKRWGAMGGRASTGSTVGVTKMNTMRKTCPHCGFVSTPGGLASHIRFKHK